MYYDHCYTDREYESEQDFYNSPDLDDDIIYNYLAQGKRQPQNEYEKRCLLHIEEMHKQGKYGYDISFN